MENQEKAVNQLFKAGYDKRKAAEIYKSLINSYGRAVGNDIILNEEKILEGIASSQISEGGNYAALAPLEELFHINNKNIKIVYQQGDKLPKGKRIGDLKQEYEGAVNQTIEKLKEKKALGRTLTGEKGQNQYDALIRRFEAYKNGTDVDYEEILAQLNNAVVLGVFNSK